MCDIPGAALPTPVLTGNYTSYRALTWEKLLVMKGEQYRCQGKSFELAGEWTQVGPRENVL